MSFKIGNAEYKKVWLHFSIITNSSHTLKIIDIQQHIVTMSIQYMQRHNVTHCLKYFYELVKVEDFYLSIIEITKHC